MAVDTRQKLFSLLSLNKPYMPNVPDPVVTFSQGDFQQFLNGYSGILWSVAIEGYREIFLGDSLITLGITGNSTITLTKEWNSLIET